MNVIVLMEDSLRKDHLGCYGNRWIRTPNIDKLASESAIFDYAYAEGLPTIPVRTALFTGRYTLPFRRWQPLEQQDVVLAEVLWNKGFETALISDTYHMHKPQMGFSRGFDHVEWIRGQESDPATGNLDVKADLANYSPRNWNPSYPGQPVRLVKKEFEQYLRNRADWKTEEDHHIARVMKASIKWLEEKVSSGKSDHLFLWIDSFDPHEPWDPPNAYSDLHPVPEYDGLPIIWGGGNAEDWELEEIRHIRSQYAGTITLCDRWTGIFLERVSDLGLHDNTMLVFVSDHGEPLGEHGIIKKTQPWPYEELSHMPLVIRLPDETQEPRQGKRVKSFVGMPDILPTIFDFLGVKCPTTVQGRTLLPDILGEEENTWDYAISGHYGNSSSIRNREWCLYYWPGADAPYTWGVGFTKLSQKTRVELYKFNPSYVPPEPHRYQLEKDQAETKNLADREPETASFLQREMLRFLEELTPSPGDLMAKDYQKRGH